MIERLHVMSLVNSLQVKYGNTFRRFSVHVDENNQMDLNMVSLKAKIRSIFNFTHANFILRYVYEEGDLVNLVDDDDLHDMMSQQLEFLRIEVHMIHNLGKKIWKEIIFNEEILFYNLVYVFVVVVLGVLCLAIVFNLPEDEPAEIKWVRGSLVLGLLTLLKSIIL